MDLKLSIKQVTNGWVVCTSNDGEDTTSVTKSKSELQRLFRQTVKEFRSKIEAIATAPATPPPVL